MPYPSSTFPPTNPDVSHPVEDYQFGMYPEELSAAERSNLYDSFSRYANSPVVMDSVTSSSVVMAEVAKSARAMADVVSSEVAMNRVSESDTAMSAIEGEDDAMQAVSEASMAIGKFVVGRAIHGGGASTADSLHPRNVTSVGDVSTSGSAMSHVADSAASMDAVGNSTLMMDGVWDSTVAWDAVKTVSMAVGKYIAGRAGLDPSNYADVAAVANDSSAMDAVGGSSLPMDAVWQSQTARDAVKTVSMAVGKYIAGRAGLDPSNYADMPAVATDTDAMTAVANDTDSMDAVRAWQLALDEVMSNNTSLGKFLAGDAGLDPASYADFTALVGDSSAMGTVVSSMEHLMICLSNDFTISELWQADPGSERVIKQFNPAPPHDFPNYPEYKLRLSSNQYGSGYSLRFIHNEGNDGDNMQKSTDLTLDLSGKSTLEFTTRASVPTTYVYMSVDLDGTNVWGSDGTSHSWTKRTVDVSEYGEGTTLTYSINPQWYNRTADCYLSELKAT